MRSLGQTRRNQGSGRLPRGQGKDVSFVLRFEGDEKFIPKAQAEETACAQSSRWEEVRYIWGE